MDVYVIILIILGAITLLTAWLPLLLRNLPLSLPIFSIGFGIAFTWLPLPPDAVFNPLEHRHLTERLTEFVVLIALRGADLRSIASLASGHGISPGAYSLSPCPSLSSPLPPSRIFFLA